MKAESSAFFVISASAIPIHFNADVCVGCNRCVDVCQCDILFPNPEKGKQPIVMYPGECYYCGVCVMACPYEKALSLAHPIMNRAKFVKIDESVK